MPVPRSPCPPARYGSPVGSANRLGGLRLPSRGVPSFLAIPAPCALTRAGGRGARPCPPSSLRACPYRGSPALVAYPLPSRGYALRSLPSWVAPRVWSGRARPRLILCPCSSCPWGSPHLADCTKGRSARYRAPFGFVSPVFAWGSPLRRVSHTGFAMRLCGPPPP
jgi:hypothetical protein